MAPLETHRPPGWSQPSLTGFFEDAWGNVVASFANKPETHRLCRIDDLLSEITLDWEGVEPTSETVIPLFMFFRAHSAFRSAAMLGMAGAITESMAVLRLALEFTGYAALVSHRPELANKWWNRDKDAAAKKDVLRAFTNGAVKEVLTQFDRSICEAYEVLYERVIQFGAHPNEKSVTTAIRLETIESVSKIDQLYLHSDGKALDFWIRTANQVGICILRVFQHVHRDRFNALNVAEKMMPLAQGL